MNIVTDEIFEHARTALQKSVETINSCVESLVTSIKEDKEYDRDAVVHLTWLTHQLIQVMAELSMLESGHSGDKSSPRKSLTDRFRR